MNNKEIEQLLKNTLKKQRLLHGYMFVGSKLTNKERASIEFAKEILCLNKEYSPCEKCKSCIEINTRNHPDFKEIGPAQGENTIKIDEIRHMQEEIIRKPIISENKVFIIKNSNKMTIRSTKLFIKDFRRTTKLCNYNITSR